MTLPALLARLEEATEGSRKLDAHIFCAVFHPDQKPAKNNFYTAREEWGYFESNAPEPGLTFHDAPRYTTSLDAALTLVPEGLGWLMDDTGSAVVINRDTLKRWEGRFPGRMPLAICIAALRARSRHE